MSRFPIGKPQRRGIPPWKKVIGNIPGFDLSLNDLPLGTTLTYKLDPRDTDPSAIQRGVWDNSSAYIAKVVPAERGEDRRKLLTNLNPHTFIFHADHVLGWGGPHWIIEIPANVLHDGSTVCIGRLHTGSGISRDLAPSGLLHDYLSRLWAGSGGYIPVKKEFRLEEEWVKVSIKDMAKIWGASVQYLTPRSDFTVRIYEWVLANAHPLFIKYGDSRPWVRVYPSG